MKPLEVWTCQRAENLKKNHRKFQKITTQQKWYRRRADKLLAAAAAGRRSTKGGGGGAHKLSAAAARRGRRTALRWQSMPRKLNLRQGLQTCIWIKRDSSASGSASLN